ncbi:MocE subfamily Rieske [2Fe-2S] domain protein [Rhizobium leguminosarum]|nr:MocE subfamily Rieske [2Fe-2S] domain protein [Rhizobium leguminosarum]
MTWVSAGKLDDIEQEGAIRFDHGGRTYAIYRGPDDSVYCTGGLCTHEAIHLADGLVMDFEVELSKAFRRLRLSHRRSPQASGLREPENL